jgi:tight adherence protein B
MIELIKLTFGEYFSPLLISLFAAGLAFIGWRYLDREIDLNFRKRNVDNLQLSLKENRFHSHRNQGIWKQGQEGQDYARKNAVTYKKSSLGKIQLAEVSSIIIVSASTYLISLILTSSKEISFSIALLSSAIPFIVSKKKFKKLEREKERAWPEAIENIVSALQAGQSIAEAINALTQHGPVQLRGIFKRIQDRTLNGTSLEISIQLEMENLENAVADQTLNSLLLAKEYGGRDVTTTLRLLAAFLREQDEAIEEIETRFGWVKNSAFLGTVAPWLLLALLSTQRNTVLAYATPAGKIVLSIGVIATGIAYIWMDRVSRLPGPIRLIASAERSELKGFKKNNFDVQPKFSEFEC